MTVSDVRYRIDVELTNDGARVATEVTFSSDEQAATAELAAVKVHSIALNGKSTDDLHLRDLHTDKDNLLRTEADVAFSADGEGLIALDADDGRFVHTRLKDHSVSRLFCCFPDAGRAQSIDLRVVAPSEWTVVSHTPAQRSANGAWLFRSDIPMPPRGVTLAAGPWLRHGDLYARPSVADRLPQTPIGPDLHRVLEHHARILGVPYPHAQRAIVFIPKYASLGGYSVGFWCLHEDLIHELSRRRTLWAVAHEAAHAWFAGVVDSAEPAERWITEGFSTYVGHRAMVDIAPDLDPWAAFHVLEEAFAHDADSGPDVHPVIDMPEPPRGHPSLVYGKPAALFRQLDDAVVDAALHRFLTANAFGRATTEDLLACLGPDLNDWATQWLREPGVDALSVDLGVSGNGIVEAAAVVVDGTRSHNFTIRVFDDNEGTLVERRPIDVATVSTSTPVPALIGHPRPALTVPNTPARTYAIVRLDDQSLTTLTVHLSELDADTRALCWVAARQQLDQTAMQLLVQRHADAEPDPWVRLTIQSWAA